MIYVHYGSKMLCKMSHFEYWIPTYKKIIVEKKYILTPEKLWIQNLGWGYFRFY